MIADYHMYYDMFRPEWFVSGREYNFIISKEFCFEILSRFFKIIYWRGASMLSSLSLHYSTKYVYLLCACYDREIEEISKFQLSIPHIIGEPNCQSICLQLRPNHPHRFQNLRSNLAQQ